MGQDRDALWKFQTVLTRILRANTCGIWKKTIMRNGLKLWDQDINGALTKDRHPDYLGNQAYSLILLLRMVGTIEVGTTTGARLPAWMLTMVRCLDESYTDVTDKDST